MGTCFNCGTRCPLSGKPGRSDTCPSCDADLRCCLNCRFYDAAAYNECREPQAERVLDKDRANFCDYFSFRSDGRENEQGAGGSGGKANPLDALFEK